MSIYHILAVRISECPCSDTFLSFSIFPFDLGFDVPAHFINILLTCYWLNRAKISLPKPMSPFILRFTNLIFIKWSLINVDSQISAILQSFPVASFPLRYSQNETKKKQEMFRSSDLADIIISKSFLIQSDFFSGLARVNCQAFLFYCSCFFFVLFCFVLFFCLLIYPRFIDRVSSTFKTFFFQDGTQSDKVQLSYIFINPNRPRLNHKNSSKKKYGAFATVSSRIGSEIASYLRRLSFEVTFQLRKLISD